MKTIVYQLGTRNAYIYTVPPKQAVVNAYYQYEITENHHKMKPNEELFATLAELLYSHGRSITFPIVVNRHKWNVGLNFFGRDDGFEFFAAFTSPNGRRYTFYMTDMCTDAEIYSRNGHLVTAQYPSNRIPSWMLNRIDFLRNVLDEY